VCLFSPLNDDYNQNIYKLKHQFYTKMRQKDTVKPHLKNLASYATAPFKFLSRVVQTPRNSSLFENHLNRANGAPTIEESIRELQKARDYHNKLLIPKRNSEARILTTFLEQFRREFDYELKPEELMRNPTHRYGLRRLLEDVKHDVKDLGVGNIGDLCEVVEARRKSTYMPMVNKTILKFVDVLRRDPEDIPRAIRETVEEYELIIASSLTDFPRVGDRYSFKGEPTNAVVYTNAVNHLMSYLNNIIRKKNPEEMTENRFLNHYKAMEDRVKKYASKLGKDIFDEANKILSSFSDKLARKVGQLPQQLARQEEDLFREIYEVADDPEGFSDPEGTFDKKALAYVNFLMRHSIILGETQTDVEETLTGAYTTLQKNLEPNQPEATC
jgi:hypothetical protein